MHFSIDQSGKIEDTSVDTILAMCSNDIQYSIKIPKKLKQDLFIKCKKSSKKNLTFRLFSFCLYLLLKNKIQKNSIILIDEEYSGHNADIKQLLLKNLKIKKEQITFGLVGKKDASHRVANQTFSGRLKPNEIITEELLNLNKIIPKSKLKKILK